MSILIAALALAAVQDTPVAGTDAPKEEKMVCRSVRGTGTRMPGPKICKTKAAWAAEFRDTDKNGRQSANSMNTKGYGGGIDSGAMPR